MLTEFLLIFVVSLFGFFLFLLSYARKNYGRLEGNGIPVIKPTLFLGSVPNSHAIVHHLEQIALFKKYGPVWSLYEGRTPHVYISDPELIRLIFVKDFDHFYNRREIDLGSELLNEVLDFLPGEKWKTVRSMLSPIFTTSKLKSQAEVIAAVSQEFVNDLRQECDTEGKLKIDAQLRLSTFLIDMFARSTLGVQLEDSKNPHNTFASSFRKLIGVDMEYGFFHTLSQVFPCVGMFAPSFDDTPAKYLNATIRSILSSRRQTGIKKASDFVDFLNELWSKVGSSEFKRLKISENTIIAQAVNFFLGGFETTTTTLSHLLYFLAENPEVQIRIQEELDAVYSTHGSFDLNSVADESIPYTLAAINEALRLAPSLFSPERICTKDWTHNGMAIKKGTVVMIASWAANRNPQCYDNPESFQPERFLPENKSSLNPYAFTTFGHGPRSCIGMRFAYYSIKLFVANLLYNFSVEKRADTKFDYKRGTVLVVGYNPIYFDFVLREKQN